MTIYYLYVKTHLTSGLKYLGKTEKDPYSYKGSGQWWKNHIRKHGYNVRTEILLMTKQYDELVETGLFFSKLFNVVESTEWANLIPESGEGVGGLKHSQEARTKMSEAKFGKPRKPHTDKTRSQISESLKGKKRKPFTEEHKQKIAQTNKDHLRRPLSEEHKRKISEAKTGKPRGKTIL
jgi:hypothetical protein